MHTRNEPREVDAGGLGGPGDPADAGAGEDSGFPSEAAQVKIDKLIKALKLWGRYSDLLNAIITEPSEEYQEEIRKARKKANRATHEALGDKQCL